MSKNPSAWPLPAPQVKSGYALLFRIASGEMLGKGPARHPATA